MDARADGMPAAMLAERKRDLVNQINEYIQQKKMLGDAQAGKNALLAGAALPETQDLQRRPTLNGSFLLFCHVILLIPS